MTPLEEARLSLLKVAAKTYGDPLTEKDVYWQSGCIQISDELEDAGDTLALFLLRELKDVTLGPSSLSQMRLAAIQALAVAIRELERVRDEFALRQLEETENIE